MLRLIENLERLLNIYGNYLILKDASKDSEWLVEDDTLHTLNLDLNKKMRSERSVFLRQPKPSIAILKRNLSQKN